MDRAALLDMVRRLGDEFRRRGMQAHLVRLRVYWLALHHGLVRDASHALHLTLSEDAVVEWFKLLRLPPYQHAYPVRPTGSACPACAPGGGPATEVVTERTFPEGRKVACLGCRTAWLEMEPPGRLRRGSDAPPRAG
ncbi:MAG TPA: hypothetical protein VEJ89_12060 [Myxococcaceae bacterium]|jgi:hypothetical protein|nr:hypothetical protein [Myxococcaceae bacterium]